MVQSSLEKDDPAAGENAPGSEAAVQGAGVFPAGHYYSPIPDMNEVSRDVARIFPDSLPRELPGIAINEGRQLALLRALRPFMAEAPFPEEKTDGIRYYYANEFYSYTDALFLYGMIRRLQPRRIVEVGSGFSSCVMLDTIERFMNHSAECTFVEPFPGRLKAVIRPTDRIHLLEQRVQDVDPRIFSTLESGDILFIDSTHVAKAGSDVNYYLFEIFPRLASGVIIHIHDVFYPFEYPRSWLLKGIYWNENYLLRAFLADNPCYEILLMSNYLGTFHRDALEALHPLCLKNTGGNLWLQKRYYGFSHPKAMLKSLGTVLWRAINPPW